MGGKVVISGCFLLCGERGDLSTAFQPGSLGHRLSCSGKQQLRIELPISFEFIFRYDKCARDLFWITCPFVSFWSLGHLVAYILTDRMFPDWKQMSKSFLCILYLTYSCSSRRSKICNECCSACKFLSDWLYWKMFSFTTDLLKSKM